MVAPTKETAMTVEYDEEVIVELRTAAQEGLDVESDNTPDGELAKAALEEMVHASCVEGTPPQELVDLFIELEGQGKLPEDLHTWADAVLVAEEEDVKRHPAKGKAVVEEPEPEPEPEEDSK